MLLGLIGAAPLLSLDAVAAGLFWETLKLSFATAAISLPVGVILAFLLARTDLPGRKLWALLLILQLFVPLYLQVAAWRAGFGLFGWFTIWAGAEGPKWVFLESWRGAVWTHAVTSLPWVVLIVGIGLRMVEGELEEEALLDGGAGQVFRRVTLRRALTSAGVAALWIGIQTTGEMTATDLFRVRTFAEELYVKMVELPQPSQVLLSVLPLASLTIWFSLAAVAVLARCTPRVRHHAASAPPVFHLGPWRWPAALLVGAVVLLLAGIPLGSLIHKAGVEVVQNEEGRQRIWSAAKCARLVIESPGLFAEEFGWSLQLAALSATAAVMLACGLAWAALRGGWRGAATMSLVAVLLALPGPLVALALIGLLNQRDVGWLTFLYDRTILAPWLALLLRSLPLATLIVWSALRSVPTETLDAATTEGAGSATRLFRIALPQRIPALLAAWLVAAALGLGDLSATILILPPGVETLQRRMFGLLHSNVEDQVAAVCLVLLTLLVAITLLVAWITTRRPIDRNTVNA